MRRSPVLALVGAIVVLAVGLTGAITGAVAARDNERDILALRATQQVTWLSDHFDRVGAAVLQTANTQAVIDFYDVVGGNRELLPGITASLAYLDTVFPGHTAAARFADADGTQHARVVRGTPSGLADPPLRVADAPYLAATLALREGAVYHSAPYVSPDTGEWVVSHSTRVPSRPAIVQVEITIEGMRTLAARAQGRSLVVDATTGVAVIDTGRPQRAGAPLGTPGEAVAPRGWTGDAGRTTIGDAAAAYRRLNAGAGNANQWYAVALATGDAGLGTGLRVLLIGLLVGALLLAGYAAVTLRRGVPRLGRHAGPDKLTGLRNRAAFDADLRRMSTGASWRDPVVVIVCDLRGFAAYRDQFGQSAADTLLARFGRTLAAAIVDRGSAYRIGAAEFGVLARPGRSGIGTLIETARAALSETGDEYAITADCATVVLPDETVDADEAARLTERRRHDRPAAHREPADPDAVNVLLRALSERDPDLARRLNHTARLTDAVCRRLNRPAADRAAIDLAAQLHDIGKLGVPDAILAKAGPLDDTEWVFLLHSPTAGERIAAASPALAPLAPIIRGCREWYDGTGYPDGLAGDAIPLGSRIVAACSAVAAMTAARPYATVLDLPDVIAELRSLSGVQFDPDVVDALVDELHIEALVEASTEAE